MDTHDQSPEVEELADTQLARDILVKRLTTFRVPNTKTISCMELSLDGKFLAVGDGQGRLTLRDMAGAKRMAILSAGSEVGITSIVWSRRQNPWTIFVASGNGYLNCVTFSQDFDYEPPQTKAIKCCGLITCMSVNDDETQLAVSYDYTTKVYPLPFEDGDPIDVGASTGFLINKSYYVKPRSPVRSYPRVVAVHYLSEHLLCVATFSKLEAYSTDPHSATYRNRVWEIAAPESTNIGSCALSPSRKLLAATNLHNGIDWYSLETLEWLSETPIQEDFSTRNYILPVRFLTEQTVVTGSNAGQVVCGSIGVVAVKRIGKRRSIPSQYLSTIRLPDKFVVAYGAGYHATVSFIELPCVESTKGATAGTTGMTSAHAQGESAAAPPESPPPDPPLDPSGKAPPTSHEHKGTPLSTVRAAYYHQPDPSFTSFASHAFQTPAETPAPSHSRSHHPTHPSPGWGRETISVETGRNHSRTQEGHSFHSLEPEQAELSDSPSSVSISLPSSPLADKSSFQPASISLGQPRPLWKSTLSGDRVDGQGMRGEADYRSSRSDRPHGRRQRSETTSRVAFLDSIQAQPRTSITNSIEPTTPNSRNGSLDDEMDEPLWRVVGMQLWSSGRDNPKLCAVLVVTIIVALIAIVSYPGDLPQGGNLESSGRGKPSVPEAFMDEEDGFRDDESDDTDYGGSGEEEGVDTVILTETKVLTVTRTVTHSATVTATVTVHSKPKRTQKSRDRRRG